jgi:hypothetical protein
LELLDAAGLFEPGRVGIATPKAYGRPSEDARYRCLVFVKFCEAVRLRRLGRFTQLWMYRPAIRQCRLEFRRDGEWEFPHRERAAGKVENQVPTAGNGVAAPEPGLMRDFIR